MKFSVGMAVISVIFLRRCRRTNRHAVLAIVVDVELGVDGSELVRESLKLEVSFRVRFSFGHQVVCVDS